MPPVSRVSPARMTFGMVLPMTFRSMVATYIAGAAVLVIFAIMTHSISGGIVSLFPPDVLRVLVTMAAVVLLTPVWVYGCSALTAWAVNRIVRRARERMFAAHPDLANDPRGSALAKVLESPRRKYSDLARVVRECSPSTGATRIVCLDGTDAPAPEDASVEPVVIAANRDLGVVASVMFVLSVGVLAILFIPGMAGTEESLQFVIMAICGWGACGLGFWRCVVSPSYVRFAPGVIQLLRYAPLARRPIVKTVLLDESTVVFVVGPKRAKHEAIWRLAVCRLDVCHEIAFSASTEQSECIWRALLSTAPTPPLSDEFLVG